MDEHIYAYMDVRMYEFIFLNRFAAKNCFRIRIHACVCACMSLRSCVFVLLCTHMSMFRCFRFLYIHMLNHMAFELGAGEAPRGSGGTGRPKKVSTLITFVMRERAI